MDVKASKARNKGGAPTKRVKRELIVRIRMSATERFLIDSKAKAAGMRSSSWIRLAAKSARVAPRLTLEERRMLWMLAELANNLNQLTRLAHVRGLYAVVTDCDRVLKRIDGILKHINKDDRESNNG